jgi:hypothetical protein
MTFQVDCPHRGDHFVIGDKAVIISTARVGWTRRRIQLTLGLAISPPLYSLTHDPLHG